MNKRNNCIRILGIFFPTPALASGIGDSLDWMGIHFFVIMAFLVFFVFIKMNWIGKGIMLVIFMVSEYVNAELTIGLPYSENLLTLKIISGSVPIATTIASYWALKTTFRKR